MGVVRSSRTVSIFVFVLVEKVGSLSPSLRGVRGGVFWTLWVGR